MSLEDKVKQLIFASCHQSGNAILASEFGVGGICLYANAFTGKTKEQVIDMITELQRAAQIPLLIGVDEEGGNVCRVSLNPFLRATPFLSPSQLFSAGGWSMIEDDTAEKALLLLSLGINLNLAPVCDVPLSASDYIYKRCFSMDAKLTAQYIDLVVSIMQQQGLGSTLKHFPGYGGSNDTHQGIAYDNRPYSDFLNSDFLPFQAGIAAGAGSVMVSHNIVTCMDPDMPASLSPEVHRILLEELGFDGVIITDDLIMAAITQFTGSQDAVVFAFLAGNDLICCSDFKGAVNALMAAVDDGTITVSQIEESVTRILRWKIQLNIL